MDTESPKARLSHVTSFGVRLRQLRVVAGLTQEELAARSGLTAKAISMLEREERRRPYPHTVRALADALDLSEVERTTLIGMASARGCGTDDRLGAASADAILPWALTPLLGRERELEEIEGFLQERRLITLTGPPGVGKTRLAIEVARNVSRSERCHTVFVSLATLVEATSVLPAAAHALGVQESSTKVPIDVLRTSIGARRLFIVLDNFEHVLEAAVDVARLLEACPETRVLATSRAPLRVQGEQEYPVLPLGLPRSTVLADVEAVLESPAGRLFVDRAQAILPSFALTAENAGGVAAICWRLAGLPLAVELVAAQVRFLDLETLLAGVDRALSRSWAREGTGRHRTMWAALDWSYDLLSTSERMVFQCLGVCSGGFSLEMAKAVSGSATEDAVESLGILVEHSLVRVEHSEEGDQQRYGMLAPVRQYAGEKLEESGMQRDAKRRQFAYVLGLAEQADHTYGLLTGTQATATAGEAWIGLLDREHDNVRAALGYAAKYGDVVGGLRLAGALSWFWWMRGYCVEGRRWIQTFINLAAQLEISLMDRMGAQAMLGEGMMAFGIGDLREAMTLLEQSLRAYRLSGDRRGMAAATVTLGYVSRAAGDDGRAEALTEEALRMSRDLDDDRTAAIAFSNLGHIARRRGDLSRAISLFTEARTRFARLGERRGLAYTLCNLGLVALDRGDVEYALELCEESIMLYDALRDEAGRGHALISLGDVARSVGDEQRAVSLYEEALAVHRKLGADRGVARALARLRTESR